MAEKEWTASIIIRMNSAMDKKSCLGKLKTIIDRFHGGCTSYLCIDIPEKSIVTLKLSEENYLSPEPDLFQEVRTLLGPGSIETRCVAIKPAKKKKKRWQSR